MKKYYFFSDKKLIYKEIKQFRIKLFATVILTSLTISAVIFTTFVLTNGSVDITMLEREKEATITKMQVLLEDYKELDNKLAGIAEDTDELRLRSNLTPYGKEARNFGTGGSIFKELHTLGDKKSEELIAGIKSSIEKLNAEATFEEKNLVEINNAIGYNDSLYKTIPAIKPVDAPYGDRYGMRYHPILKYRRMHNGLDIQCISGSKVYAPGDGVVSFAGRKGGYGRTIEIDHGFGYKSVYAHLYRYKVKKGQKVKRGQLIGLSGSSGSLSTGPHLHYEIRHNGITVDPFNYIQEGVQFEDYPKLAEAK